MKESYIHDRAGSVDVVRSGCLLFDPQRPLVLCNRLIGLALMLICYSEVVDGVGRVDVIHPECLLIDPQRPFVLCDRLIVLALIVIGTSELVDRVGRIDVIHYAAFEQINQPLPWVQVSFVVLVIPSAIMIRRDCEWWAITEMIWCL